MTRDLFHSHLSHESFDLGKFPSFASFRQFPVDLGTKPVSKTSGLLSPFILHTSLSLLSIKLFTLGLSPTIQVLQGTERTAVATYPHMDGAMLTDHPFNQLNSFGVFKITTIEQATPNSTTLTKTIFNLLAQDTVLKTSNLHQQRSSSLCELLPSLAKRISLRLPGLRQQQCHIVGKGLHISFRPFTLAICISRSRFSSRSVATSLLRRTASSRTLGSLLCPGCDTASVTME